MPRYKNAISITDFHAFRVRGFRGPRVTDQPNPAQKRSASKLFPGRLLLRSAESASDPMAEPARYCSLLKQPAMRCWLTGQRRLCSLWIGLKFQLHSPEMGFAGEVECSQPCRRRPAGVDGTGPIADGAVDACNHKDHRSEHLLENFGLRRREHRSSSPMPIAVPTLDLMGAQGVPPPRRS